MVIMMPCFKTQQAFYIMRKASFKPQRAFRIMRKVSPKLQQTFRHSGHLLRNRGKLSGFPDSFAKVRARFPELRTGCQESYEGFR